MCGKHPSWKQLISPTLSKDECISLIETIPIDSNQVKIVKQFSEDDAQNFIDNVHEVSLHPISRSIDFDSNLHILSTRH
jgi:hypothetical protein